VSPSPASCPPTHTLDIVNPIRTRRSTSSWSAHDRKSPTIAARQLDVVTFYPSVVACPRCRYFTLFDTDIDAFVKGAGAGTK
jgi:hypothetical protein